MKRPAWMVVIAIAIAAGVSVNLAYANWAASSPAHDEWVDYVWMAIPPAVAAGHDVTNVTAQLRGAGWIVTVWIAEGVEVLNATQAAEPNYRSGIWGLGRSGEGSIWTDIRCTVKFAGGGCPGDPEILLRAKFSELVRDSGLPLNPANAQFGDYDFAGIGETFLGLYQICLGAVTLLVVGPLVGYGVVRLKQMQQIKPLEANKSP